MCLYPKLLMNPKYKKNKKNGGVIPPISDNRVLYVPIGCGKCIECKKQKAREWQVRINEEIRTDKTGQMVTLTFSENELRKLTYIAEQEYNINKIEENEIATLAVRRFLERWRKENKKSVKHWLISELGHNNTERIHLHGIIWTTTPEQIKKHWKYGYVTLGNGVQNYVNEKTINYIIKYVTKIDKDHKGYEGKILTSAGIGKGFLNRIDKNNNKFKDKDTNETYKTRTGLKLALPKYYRNYLYSDEEKEKLWINKLNKNERWICGEKIDISQSEDSYYKTLEHYKKLNIRLGYGNDKKEWSIEQYKIQRKNLKELLKKNCLRLKDNLR